MATFTFLDTDVLIAAHRGESPSKELAQGLLQDATRAFVVSPFLYLELLPKPTYFKNTAELAFFKTYFDNARIFVNDLTDMVRIGIREAEKCGLGAVDALHVAAAHIAGAEVLITLEDENHGMFRTSLVKVIRLQ